MFSNMNTFYANKYSKGSCRNPYYYFKINHQKKKKKGKPLGKLGGRLP